MIDETLTENEKAVNLKFALYMGATDINKDKEKTGLEFPPNMIFVIPETGTFNVASMKYVRSWDWLLPVWDKASIDNIKIQADEKTLPIQKEVCKVQLDHFVEQLKNVNKTGCIMILQDIIDTIKKHNENK